MARLRRDDPWFPAAFPALEAIMAGKATSDSAQAIAGHFPWLDDPDQFVATTAAFLG